MNFSEQSYTGRVETEALIDEVIDSAFNSVCCTMGPNASLALIIEKNESILIRDGVRVAKALDFNEVRRNAIAKLITSAAIKTDEMVGDGTTTTVFMVNALYHRLKNMLDFKTSAYVSGLVKETRDLLSNMITEVNPRNEKFVRMVYTTTNYQSDIADTVIDLFREYRSPKITLKRGMGHPHDVVEVKNDIVFEGRYASPHLQPNTPRAQLNVVHSAVVLTDGMINTLSQEQAKTLVDNIVTTHKPCVIVARHFEPDVIDRLIGMNVYINEQLGLPKDQQRLFIIPFCLHASGSAGGNIFKDLARLLGTVVYSSLPEPSVISERLTQLVDGLTLNMFGFQFDKQDSVIKERSDSILNELEPVFESMTITERANVLGKIMQSRIGRLRAENVVITVSGMTDAEISERYYLFEDACRVAETSLRFGVIPGIGYGFNQAAEQLYQKHVTDVLAAGLENGSLDVAHEIDIAKLFCAALTSQYHYLTGEEYVIGGENKYLDLVRNEHFDVPEFVFDNGCAAMSAIEAAWSVVKGLGKTAVILGKSNHSYDI